MLPAAARMTRRTDFELAVRRGRRAGRPRLVMHAYSGDAAEPSRVGFVVSRNVGGSVVRHRVQRRLRHLMRNRLDELGHGTLLVVRALPASAPASSAELAADLDSGLRRLRLNAGAQ